MMYKWDRIEFRISESVTKISAQFLELKFSFQVGTRFVLLFSSDILELGIVVDSRIAGNIKKSGGNFVIARGRRLHLESMDWWTLASAKAETGSATPQVCSAIVSASTRLQL